MREIKFRAWDTKHKKMRGVMDLKWSKKGVIRVNATEDEDNYEPLLLHFDEGLLMQFTGLKDKNGKEIYEGDIVECDRYDDHDKFIVKIDDITNLSNMLFGSSLNYRKVLGNIYENPELITKQ